MAAKVAKKKVKKAKESNDMASKRSSTVFVRDSSRFRIRERLFGLSKAMQILIVVSSIALIGASSYLLGMSNAASNTTYDVQYCKNSPTWRITRRGDRGGCVYTIQSVLRYNAHYRAVCGNLEVDGQFGPITESRVKCFQGREGLTRDGIVGNNTWHALYVTCLENVRTTSGYNLGICRDV